MFGGLEEAKADVVGVLCVQWLVEHGVIPREKQNMLYASYMGETFRTVRFGVAEAHGKGRIMEFNYLAEQGAVRRDGATGYYEVDFPRMPAAIALLAKELLEQEATGDRARVERWFSKYGQMPTELADALAKASDIPVDVDPDFDFHPPLRSAGGFFGGNPHGPQTLLNPGGLGFRLGDGLLSNLGGNMFALLAHGFQFLDLDFRLG